MNLERALAIPGFMHEIELTYLAELARKSMNIIEIGSWQGRSTRAFADNTDGCVSCIDTWADNAFGNAPAEVTCNPDWLWMAFRDNLSDRSNVTPYRMTSMEAATLFRKEGSEYDLIFIDGSHDYESVKADILAWRPLLRKGGILCGHDLYSDGPFHPGVLQAVNELVGKYRTVGTIWTTEEV